MYCAFYRDPWVAFLFGLKNSCRHPGRCLGSTRRTHTTSFLAGCCRAQSLRTRRACPCVLWHILSPPVPAPSLSLRFCVVFFLAFLIYATFSYLMYCKLPCKPGIGPSGNLNPQITNMALFQRMTLLHSDRVDALTLLQTFILHGKWPRPCAQGLQNQVGRAWPLPSHLVRKRRTRSYRWCEIL